MNWKLQPGFDDVPVMDGGKRLLATMTTAQYEIYLSWLADYLYRPEAGAEELSFDDAVSEVLTIETEIAHWIWDNLWKDYPFPKEEHPDWPAHSDIFYRKELSAILSRVPSKKDRIKAMEIFYQELDRDASK